LSDYKLKSKAKVYEKFSAYTKISTFKGNSSIVKAYKYSSVLRQDLEPSITIYYMFFARVGE